VRNLFRFVGLRHLLNRPGRTLLTTIGVGLGVSLYIAIEIINRSTLASFKESIDAIAGKAQLSITAGETGFPEDKIDIIQKISGVKHAVPMIEAHAYFAGTKVSNETLVILGVDLLKEQGVRTYKTTDEEVIEDPLVFLNQPDSIILTHAFAKSHGLEMDSVFEIATARGKRKLTVRGLLTPEGPARAYGGALAIMDIDGARVTFGKENKTDRIDIIPTDGIDLEVVKQNITESLGPGFDVQRPSSQSEGMERLVKSYQVMLSFFSLLALLVGLFLVTNSVSISVAERRREIGTLRALGATRVGILILFLSEAVVMGVVGAFGGVWLGRWLSTILLKTVTTSLSHQYMMPIKSSKVVFGSEEMILGIILGAGASFIAALIPSFRATYIQPLEAMRKSELSQQVAKKNIFTLSLVTGLLLLIFLTISSNYQWRNQSDFLRILNQVSTMVGPALVGPTVVAGLIFLFRSFAIRMGGTVTRLAYDNLLRNPKRTGSNVTTLIVGLILVIIVASMNVSFKSTIVGWFSRVLHVDLLVASNGNLITYEVQPLHEDIGKNLEDIQGIKKGPHGGTYAIRFIHLQYEGKQLALKAYDEPHPDEKYSVFDVQDRNVEEAGRELFHSKTPTVFVSENFVMHFKKKTGDVIELNTPTGKHKFQIAGVIVDFASPEGIFYIDRVMYKKLWNDSLVDGFGIKALPGYDPALIRKEIDQRFGQSLNLMTTSNSELKEGINRSIDESFAYTYAIQMAALLVALLGLLNTFMISVIERTRELGMLRAVGMSRGQMMNMILQEALVQGGFGALVAVGFGAWISEMWIRTSLSQVLGWIIKFSFPWSAIATTIGAGVLITLIAGVYPAWRASRLEIREALEYE